MNALFAIINGMQAVTLCSNKILQLLTGTAQYGISQTQWLQGVALVVWDILSNSRFGRIRPKT